MKIIGIDEHGNYIAVVSKDEVKKVCDKYWGDMPDLKVGKEFGLGAGFDFRRDIQSACQNMVSASKEFHDAQKTLFAFAQMVSKLPGTDAAPVQTEKVAP